MIIFVVGQFIGRFLLRLCKDRRWFSIWIGFGCCRDSGRTCACYGCFPSVVEDPSDSEEIDKFNSADDTESEA